jgi:hypothetical protein
MRLLRSHLKVGYGLSAPVVHLSESVSLTLLNPTTCHFKTINSSVPQNEPALAGGVAVGSVRFGGGGERMNRKA